MEMYNSIFYSHKEIYETLKTEKRWDEPQIVERRNRIVAFIKDNWLNWFRSYTKTTEENTLSLGVLTIGNIIILMIFDISKKDRLK